MPLKERAIPVEVGGLVNSFFRNILLAINACLLCMTAICQPPQNGPAPRTRQYTGQTAQRAKDRGWTVYQGDIILDKIAPAVVGGRPRPELLTVASQSSLWPQVGGVATVYYVNANAGATDSVDIAANENIQTAITTFNNDFAGIIQWVPWNSSDGPNYVNIDLEAGNTSGECEAAEGYEAEPLQPMGGSAYCTVGTILHEMGHIIGLWHEFQRPDRDNYVTVNYGNVIKGSWGNFEILTQNAQILGLYDYASVMQYPPYSFSRNGGPVIETIPAGMPLSNVEGVPEPVVDGVPVEDTGDYSAGDKEAIERLYGAPPTQVTVTSNPIGLQVEVDGTAITTPQTYSWTLGSTHTLAVLNGVQTLSGGIEASTTTATFYYTYGRWNDNGLQSHTITVLPGDGGAGFPATSPQVATYSANFIQLVPYSAAVYPTSTGKVAISPPPQSYTGVTGEFFVARQQATLTATPASGWSFYEFNNSPFWLPGGLGANPKTFYVPDTGNPVDTTAEFSNTPVYTFDITPDIFSSNLYVYVDGIFSYTPRNFSHYYDYSGQTTPMWTTGSSHTLEFDTPESPYSGNSRYAFSTWSDGGAASHSITSLPSTSTRYVATVIPQFAPATNFSYPPCGGTGALTPPSPTGDGFYPSGTKLTFAATPDSQWTFAGWTFDLTGTTTPTTLSPTDESLVFANFNLVAAPLTLTSVSPASAIAGGSAFTLTLYGTGFSQNSVVGVNNGTATTYPTVTYVSQEELTMQISATDIASPGALQIYVENFPPGSKGCAVFGYQTFQVNGTSLATSTAVSSSSNPSAYGSTVTFTATVASAESNATGTITFSDGSTVLGTAALNGSGAASYSTASLAAGAHSITAVYSGDSNNAGSTSAVFTQTVGQASQTINFPAIGSHVALSNVALAATASSGLPVSFSSTTPSVCAVSGTSASLIEAGTCTIQASQAGNSVYSAATPVTQSFTVTLASQTITFGVIAKQVAATKLTLEAVASSGLTVSFSSTTTKVCTISGTTASLIAAGTCTIAASQAGNNAYHAATSVKRSFTVARASQTITFPAIASQVAGSKLTLKATASSGLKVSFTATTTKVCTVSGTTASMVAAGACTIKASQAGNSAYLAATPVEQSFTVSKK
jgi:hypothetical protein